MLMKKSGLMRSTVLALAVALPVLAGCSSNPFTPPVDDGGGLPSNTPLNDSPQNTMLRFEATYENQVLAEYEKLFTSNFRFTFSSQADPALEQQYGTSWGKDDETESTSHLFSGFTDIDGNFQAPASQIILSISGASFIPEPTLPDSGDYYRRVIVPVVNLSIKISDANSTEYQIEAPHDFYLVRGDVAVLDAAQEARADRWYIYRWDDRTPTPPGGAARLASLDAGGGTIRSSWGQLKGTYAAR